MLILSTSNTIYTAYIIYPVQVKIHHRMCLIQDVVSMKKTADLKSLKMLDKSLWLNLILFQC